jgi:hypothetical protein
MKITEKEFRRLHFKSRALDRVCRILWPDGKTPSSADDYVIVDDIENTIGDYRPGPQEGPSAVEMLQDAIDKIR